jgi:hypothetical protein
MTRNQIITVIAILLLICCCMAGLAFAGLSYMGKTIGSSVENAGDPARVAEIREAVADYDIPAGYQELAFDIFFMKYIMLMPEFSYDDPMIMLMQIPDNMTSAEEMQRQMERSMAQQSGRGGNVNMEVVEQKTITIRGQQVPATISEGQTESGVTMRQMTTVFKGKNGLAVLMIMGEKSSWDQQAIDQFIASIR